MSAVTDRHGGAGMVHGTAALPPQLHQRMQQHWLPAGLRAGGNKVAGTRPCAVWLERHGDRVNTWLQRERVLMALLSCAAQIFLLRDGHRIHRNTKALLAPRRLITHQLQRPYVRLRATYKLLTSQATCVLLLAWPRPQARCFFQSSGTLMLLVLT